MVIYKSPGGNLGDFDDTTFTLPNLPYAYN